MTEREKFEEVVKFHLDDNQHEKMLERANGGSNYSDEHVDFAWIFWQAATASTQKQMAELVAENSALKFYLRNGPVIRKGGELVAAHQFAPETPATDAFIAEQQAIGVEKLADYLLCPDLDETIRSYAQQLRDEVKP